MEPWIIWIIAAAALLIIEILSQMVWTLCLSAGSLAGMTAALAGADPLWQAVAMAVTAVATYIVIIPWYRRWHESVIARSGHQSDERIVGLQFDSADFQQLFGKDCVKLFHEVTILMFNVQSYNFPTINQKFYFHTHLHNY